MAAQLRLGVEHVHGLAVNDFASLANTGVSEDLLTVLVMYIVEPKH